MNPRVLAEGVTGRVLAEVVYRVELSTRDELGRERVVVEYVAGSDQALVRGDVDEALGLASARVASRGLRIIADGLAVVGSWGASE